MQKTWTDQMVSHQLSEIVSLTGFMPSRDDLEKMGRSDLDNQVQKRGGYSSWAKRIGATPKKDKDRSEWTEQMIAAELSKAIQSVGKMPSANMLVDMGLSALSSQIQKRGGFTEWALRLGVDRAHSDSDTGWDGENALLKKMVTKGFSVERMRAVKSPYDLRVDGVVRIDVKSANYAEYGACRGWFYRIGKEAQADVLALYQLDTGAVYFLPWNLCPTTNVTIARDGGKYKAFRERFDIIRALVAARSNERKLWQ